MTPGNMLLDRIRGGMVGAVLGDCLGAPVECKYWHGIDRKTVRERFDVYMDNGSKQNNGKSIMNYTDDTAMARQVALSLIDKKGLDIPDMAQRFVDEYTKETLRGYGSSVGEVFRKLSKTNFESEETVFKPASEQFDGSGSRGNGAAMRAHPVGLFSQNQTQVEEIATKQARLTHSNNEGVAGSILQATGMSQYVHRLTYFSKIIILNQIIKYYHNVFYFTAVHIALNQETTEEMLQRLLPVLQKWEKEKSINSNNISENQDLDRSYVQQLKKIEILLGDNYNEQKCVEMLGNEVEAVKSVPTALFCFLKAKNPVDGFCETNSFQRTLELAMSFGGDSDTIMSMAGAIAGAYYGEKNIPQNLMNICEGVSDAQYQADEIFKLLNQNATQ